MKVLAHRSGAGLRVESTLAAFADAIDLGADGAEPDVHLMHDGCVVVHHNHRLNGAYRRNNSGTWSQLGVVKLPLPTSSLLIYGITKSEYPCSSEFGV